MLKINPFTALLRKMPNADSRELLNRFAKNYFVEQALERTPLKDALYICNKYKENPALYDDAFSGKLKFFLKGLHDRPTPIFNPKNNKFSLKELFNPKSMLEHLVGMFDAFDSGKSQIKKISLQLNEDKGNLNAISFDEGDNAINYVTLNIKTKGSSLFKKDDVLYRMLKAATDQRLDIIRG